MKLEIHFSEVDEPARFVQILKTYPKLLPTTGRIDRLFINDVLVKEDDAWVGDYADIKFWRGNTL